MAGGGLWRRSDRSAGAGPGGLAALFGLVLALSLLLIGAPTALAAERANVDVEVADTFGRVVLSFPSRNIMPRYRINADNGVLVVEFDDPVEMRVDRVSSLLTSYVTIARVDPEMKGARFALTRGTRVSTMEAGAKLFLDFLPPTWTGPPPRLPPEVIAELAQRAEDAANAAREAELLRSSGVRTPKLDFKVSETPTFTRFTFQWNVPYEADFKRNEAGISVVFNRSAKVDLSAIRAAMPPFVDDISVDSDDAGTSFLIAVPPAVDVRAFREEDTYVVDVQGEIDPPDMASAAEAIRIAANSQSTVPATARQLVTAPGTDPAGPGVGGTSPASSAPSAGQPASSPMAGPAPVEDADPAETPASQPSPKTIESLTAAPPLGASPVDQGAGTAMAGRSSAPPLPNQVEVPDGVADRKLADGVVRVEAKRVGGSTRIVFPYPHEIGAAMFMRGSALWLVLDDPAPIDPAPLQDALAGFARRIEAMKIGETQAIRIELSGALLSTLNPDGTRWIVTIGDIVMEPTRPLPIKRLTKDDGQTILEIPFGPVNRIHQIDDPVVGDRLFVVTGKGQPRGLVKPQTFVEMDGLASAHGLALVPKVDDLQIKAAGELVSLMRPEGLKLSPAVQSRQAAGLDVPQALNPSFAAKPGAIDFTGSVAENPKDYWAKWHRNLAAVSQAPETESKVDAWYNVATFKIANGLGAEALGILNHILQVSPEEAPSPEMMIRRAAASLMMHRPKDAVDILARDEFSESPDAAVWRTIALNDLGDYMEARKNLSRGEPIIDGFPPPVQRRFMLAGISASIELGDFARARTLLAKVDPKSLDPSEKAALDLLNARAMDASGNASDAVELLSDVIRKTRGPTAAEATYRLVGLQRREGLITLDQAIDRLEQLAVSWRGDEIEIRTLRTLGQYTIEKGDYRRAFEVMRTAVQIDPQSDVTRMMQDEMQAAFASLYLDGEADKMKPVDALALYYDFREMTPPGRRGDAMVRKLAERLIDVDLLPQAAELLNYQIEKRMTGAARSQVAADLALVYLLDRRPERALLTLGRTRQAELPLAIERQRRIVEARALADTGKGDLGLDLLTPLSGNDVSRLKADILWSSERYVEAGEQFERLLGGRWHDELPLSDVEQIDVMKASVAYSLAGDRLAMDRLRAKFVEKMAGTPNGAAFEVVSSPILARGQNFQEIVRSIASVNTLATFLSDYRQRYLEVGGAERPEVVSQAPDAAAPQEAAAAPAPPAG